MALHRFRQVRTHVWASLRASLSRCGTGKNQMLFTRLLPAVLFVGAMQGAAQRPATNDPPEYGPYSGVFLPDGMGLRMAMANAHDSVLLASAPWTLYCWVRTSGPVHARELVAGVGSVTSEYPRYLAFDAGKVMLWMGEGNELSGAANLTPDAWHLLAASFDGSRFHLYSDGQPVGSGSLVLGSANALLQMAPADLTGGGQHFGGQIASFTVLRRALTDVEVRELHQSPPDFSVIQFDEGSKPWPFQTRGQAGYRAPQDPSTLPKSRAPFSRPVALKRPPIGPSMVETGAGEWTFSDGWTMREAPKVDADGRGTRDTCL